MSQQQIRREMKEPFDKALEQVVAMVQEARRAPSGRLDLIEGRLMDLLKELGTSLLQKSVDASTPESGHGSVKCPCGKKSGVCPSGDVP